MKDLLCVDGLDDVDSVYAGKEVVMIGFKKHLSKIYPFSSSQTALFCQLDGSPFEFWIFLSFIQQKNPNNEPESEKHQSFG